MPSQYQLHVARWHDCERCELFKTRQKVVLARGKLPCDILFCGESPGASEDVIGKPFQGPAGHMLDRMIAQSIPKDWRLAFTNIISCFPIEYKGDKSKGIDPAYIKACAPRLKEFVEIAQPQLVVAVGKLSEQNVSTSLEDFDGKYKYVSIIHPSAILQADVTQRGLMYQKNVVTLRDSVDELVPF
jgi:uracil-DNA glycosylase family 4